VLLSLSFIGLGFKFMILATLMTCCCELLCRPYEGIIVSHIHGDKTAYTLEAGMPADFAVEREIVVPLDIVWKMGSAVCFVKLRLERTRKETAASPAFALKMTAFTPKSKHTSSPQHVLIIRKLET